MLAVALALAAIPAAQAQFQSGGVDKEGTWHAGEGLKAGDYFSYSMCHVDYKECANFEMDFWVKGDITVGSEVKWIAEAVVYDGNKVVVGELELGKIAPEPTGGSAELSVYRGALKSSVVWLSAFATSDSGTGGKGPKAFSATSWGKIGNIGGEQVLPLAIETVTVPAGTWETVQVGWKTGGASSKVWIVDGFPFPIKAKTFTHVSEGIPPTEYEFVLLEYREGVTESPFAGITPSDPLAGLEGCETGFEKDAVVKKSTKEFNYQIHAFYGPSEPVTGCPMQWLLKFISKYDDTEFLNQVQFDFWVVDDDLKPVRSIAEEEGRQFLYSPSGQYILDMIVTEDPGEVNYVVWVYGLAPEIIVPSTPHDYLQIPVTVIAGGGTAAQSPPVALVPPVQQEPPVQATPPTPPAEPGSIPSWVKTSAGWWADGMVDDDSFIQGIQYLIREGIIQIPPTDAGSGDGQSVIPSWVKTSAGWWADGQVDDDSFIQGIQYLIRQGIISIS